MPVEKHFLIDEINPIVINYYKNNNWVVATTQ